MIKPMNRAESDAYNDLAAAVTMLTGVDDALRERMRLVRNGYRDYKGALSALMRLMRAMSETIEPDKRRQLRKHAEHVRIKLAYGPEASRDPEMHLVMTEDFGVILHAAGEQCKLCMEDGSACRRCQLGRALDRASYVSREGRAWWEILQGAERPVDAGEA
jgi:hypothetical protein